MDSPAELQKRVERLEWDYYRDFYAACPASVAASMGVSLVERDGLLLFSAAGLDHPMFNRTGGLGFTAPFEPRLLDDCARHYARLGVTRYMHQVLPCGEDEAMRRAFAERGLVRLRGWEKHLGSADSPAQAKTDLEVRPIGPELADDWAAIVVDGFDMPPALHPWLAASVGRERWRHYAAFDGDAPVAAAALFLHDGVGHLCIVATREHAQRRGAHGALLARRIADARAAGCRDVMSETDEDLQGRPNPSSHNQARYGLFRVFVRANWGPPPQAK